MPRIKSTNERLVQYTQLTRVLVLHHGDSRANTILGTGHHFVDEKSAGIRFGKDKSLLADV